MFADQDFPNFFSPRVFLWNNHNEFPGPFLEFKLEFEVQSSSVGSCGAILL